MSAVTHGMPGGVLVVELGLRVLRLRALAVRRRPSARSRSGRPCSSRLVRMLPAKSVRSAQLCWGACVVVIVASGQKSLSVHMQAIGRRRLQIRRDERVDLGRRAASSPGSRSRCTSRARSCSRRRAGRSCRSARTGARTSRAWCARRAPDRSTCHAPATAVDHAWYLNRPASVSGVRREIRGTSRC